MSERLRVLLAPFAAERPVPFERWRLPAAVRVLVLAPHPDDFDAVAVTLRRLHTAGHRIEVVVLTGAASGVEDRYPGAVDNAAKRAIREREQRASCRAFGLPDERLAFVRLDEGEDGHMTASEANRERVGAVLRSAAPELVFVPHGNDTNPDHRRTAAFLADCVGRAGSAMVVCRNRDPKTLAMRTDLVTGFGEDDACWKGELLRCHASQHARNLNTRGHGFDERVLRVNRQIAAELGGASPYAECFEVEGLGVA